MDLQKIKAEASVRCIRILMIVMIPHLLLRKIKTSEAGDLVQPRYQLLND